VCPLSGAAKSSAGGNEAPTKSVRDGPKVHTVLVGERGVDLTYDVPMEVFLTSWGELNNMGIVHG
jgi:hypothetical protein